MSSPRRLAAAAAVLLLAISAFAVPACEVDSSTRPRGSHQSDIVERTTPPVAPRS